MIQQTGLSVLYNAGAYGLLAAGRERFLDKPNRAAAVINRLSLYPSHMAFSYCCKKAGFDSKSLPSQIVFTALHGGFFGYMRGGKGLILNTVLRNVAFLFFCRLSHYLIPRKSNDSSLVGRSFSISRQIFENVAACSLANYATRMIGGPNAPIGHRVTLGQLPSYVVVGQLGNYLILEGAGYLGLLSEGGLYREACQALVSKKKG